MDNATHAFAGLLLADATLTWMERRTGVRANNRLRRAVVGLGIIAAELPDGDLVYSGPLVGMGKLGYLLHHRGHTHTIVFAVAAALLMWWIVMVIRRRATGVFDVRERTPLLVLAMAGTLSHLLLDYSNSYGVHPFWPVNNAWVYGDSVFIIEPWLWVAAIPPLLFGIRKQYSRVLLSMLLGIILVASWALGEVSRPLAIAVCVGATLWLVAQRWIPRHRRVWAGIGAWCLVELAFVISTGVARDALSAPLEPDERVVDVVLSPAAANPFCIDAIVVSLSQSEYRVRTATVAPWPLFRGTSTSLWPLCGTRRPRAQLVGLPGATTLPSVSDSRIRWGEQWIALRSELTSLAASRCEVAAALRFVRVPVWALNADSSVQLSDVRFGVGTNGFSDTPVAAGPCTLAPNTWIPPWTPPRADVMTR